MPPVGGEEGAGESPPCVAVGEDGAGEWPACAAGGSRGSRRRARPWERTERRGRMVTTMGVVTERIKERDGEGAAESWGGAGGFSSERGDDGFSVGSDGKKISGVPYLKLHALRERLRSFAITASCLSH